MMQQCGGSARVATRARGQPSAPATTAARTRGRQTLVVRAIFTTRTATRDATAELLAAALKLGLQSRLKKYTDIQVDVQSNALDLLSGKFGGMRVVGKRWCTPLLLTADTCEVAVGELLVDQSALMFQQRVALRNIPSGSCTFVLTPTDLGNFMAHPLLAQPAATAVNGHAFHFNSSTVTFTRGAGGRGQVLYTGSCDVSGHTHMYSVSMEAAVAASTIHAIHGAAPGASRGAGNAGGPVPHGGGVKVTARRVHGAPVHPTTPHHEQQQQGPVAGHAAAQPTPRLQPHQQQQPRTEAVGPPPPAGGTVQAAHQHQQHRHQQHQVTPDEAAVSDQLSALFSHLTLNMQGVELSTPKLRLVPQSGPGSAAATRHSSSSARAGTGGGGAQEPLLLEIRLDLRLLELPPLNMKF